MKELQLQRGIGCDVTHHDGAWYVASHAGGEVRVERCSADLSSSSVELRIPQPTGNAAPRLCSWQGVLWLVYRDVADVGHLVRLDTGKTFVLGKVFGQRPFIVGDVGDGYVAWQTSATSVKVGLLNLTIIVNYNLSSAPTGLSHFDKDGNVVTWEQMRTLHPWGAGWTVDGAAEFAEGHHGGIVGQLLGQSGFFSLWPGQQVHDPRVSVSQILSDPTAHINIAVCGWSTNGPIRVAVVTAADLVPNLPGPAPIPSQPAPLPSTIAQIGRPAIWAYWKAVDLLAPCNAVVIEQQADLALTHTSRPLIILRPMLPSCWQYWDRVLAVLIHEEGGQAAVEAQARLAILQMKAAGVPKRDVMTYTGKTLHPSAKGVDIHGIQAYLPPDTANPAAAMAKRIRADAAQFGPKQRMVLHGQAYDRRTYNDPTRKPANTSQGWTDVEGLKALQTVYPAMLNADSRMVGCLWFHDGQRQGGTRDYPELIPYHARCVAVTPGPPAIPVIVSPPPPDPDPPVDDEEEPSVPTPVKFPPMSDAERADMATMIETIYDTIYPDREQRQTRVDPLGYGRWPVDYLVARARGADHQGGIKTMRAALFSAAGVPDPDPQ